MELENSGICREQGEYRYHKNASGAVHLNEWFETHPFLKQMRRRLSVELAVCLLLFCGVFLAARYAGLASAGADAVLGKKKPVVFLDAGHGGTQLRK